MRRLVEQDQLAVYRHHGYWQNMDTLRDKTILQELWDGGNPPWRVWDGQETLSAPVRAEKLHSVVG